MILISILVVTLAAAEAVIIREPQSASEAQIKFANENKYDDTGPLTKPVTAYQTFNNLDDVLITYVDDPDTKLPEYVKSMLYNKFVVPAQQIPEANIADKEVKISLQYVPLAPEPEFERPLPHFSHIGLHPIKLHKFHKIHSHHHGHHERLLVKSPEELRAEKENEPSVEIVQSINPQADYSFSYGVHDRHTGDSKSAHEMRHGDSVRGFYTIMDPDGKQRTVHYTANDHEGFQAVVRRTDAEQ